MKKHFIYLLAISMLIAAHGNSFGVNDTPIQYDRLSCSLNFLDSVLLQRKITDLIKADCDSKNKFQTLITSDGKYAFKSKVDESGHALAYIFSLEKNNFPAKEDFFPFGIFGLSDDYFKVFDTKHISSDLDDVVSKLYYSTINRDIPKNSTVLLDFDSPKFNCKMKTGDPIFLCFITKSKQVKIKILAHLIKRLKQQN